MSFCVGEPSLLGMDHVVGEAMTQHGLIPRGSAWKDTPGVALLTSLRALLEEARNPIVGVESGSRAGDGRTWEEMPC